MNKFVAIARVIYWCAVAYFPIAIDKEIKDFMINHNCMPGTECITLAMPLMVQISIIGFAAMALLWPVVAWKLGGNALWKRYRKNRKSTKSSEADNA
jgi:Sec-independent protein secretion pathway component TatC